MHRSHRMTSTGAVIAAVISAITPASGQTVQSGNEKASSGASTTPELRHSDSQPGAQKNSANGGATVNATYGDWVLKCLSDSQNAKLCELTQLVIEKEKRTPFAQIAIGRLKPDQPLQVTLVAPTNVTFASAARVKTDEKDPNPVDLGWARCLPNACYASAQIKEETFRSWMTKTGPGQVLFLNGAGQVMTIPISFKGLEPGIAAMSRMK
jgi:invasion protein IalB